MRGYILSACLFLAAFLCFPAHSRAEIWDGDTRWGATPLHKLERGVINLCTCPLELPASMVSVADEKGEIFGFVIGAAEGAVTVLFRAVSGAYDTLTFFIPSYSRPIMEPEYAIESFEEAMR
ncbi:MAG: exosortase system-associated protein, TIGR04073 family [Candidatus Omnitrophica bacterium]|nr:exosortase system-associated protein, TIGR04073 family [Candidatus Omnitrophota bacterium]MDD5500390.1 exosortase system-associated protein, TIGR04073 family [Candidatus Omnitrophota bacterium]